MKPVDNPTYTPNRLLDHVMEALGVTNDSQLGLVLDFQTAQLCRVRSRKEMVSATLIVSILDCTNFSIKDVRRLAGLPMSQRKRKGELQGTLTLPQLYSSFHILTTREASSTKD